MQHEADAVEMDAIQYGVQVGVKSGPGLSYDLQRLAGAILVTAATWDEHHTQFRVNLIIDTIGYVDQADFQLIVNSNTVAYSTAMCREAKTGGYSCHYHYMDGFVSGIPTLPIVGQLAGESIAQLFYGPESQDSLVFQQ